MPRSERIYYRERMDERKRKAENPGTLRNRFRFIAGLDDAPFERFPDSKPHRTSRLRGFLKKFKSGSSVPDNGDVGQVVEFPKDLSHERKLYSHPSTSEEYSDTVASHEAEVAEPIFTQQEAAVYNYLLQNALETLYAPEESIGDGVTAADVGKILEDQALGLDRNFRKVVSNGPEYYLKIRSQALDKIKQGEENGRQAIDVIGPDFEDLSLALSSMTPDELQGIQKLLSERTPEQIIDEEFPQGVTEENQLDKVVSSDNEREYTLKDEVESIVSRFDGAGLYEIKNGMGMYVPFKKRFFSGAFDIKNFDKGDSIGLISPLGLDPNHQMRKYSRKDLIKLYWAVTFYNLKGMQKLSVGQKAELDEIGRMYDEIMEEKRMQQKSVVSFGK